VIARLQFLPGVDAAGQKARGGGMFRPWHIPKTLTWSQFAAILAITLDPRITSAGLLVFFFFRPLNFRPARKNGAMAGLANAVLNWRSKKVGKTATLSAGVNRVLRAGCRWTLQRLKWVVPCRERWH